MGDWTVNAIKGDESLILKQMSEKVKVPALVPGYFRPLLNSSY
jgi:hypothetical protein